MKFLQVVPHPPQPVRPPHMPQIPPTVTGANLMPIRPPQPPIILPPQPFFMAPQPPQIPLPFSNMPNLPASAPPLPGLPKPPMDVSGEPPAKRMRGEESLIPEREFLARQHSPVTFKVAVPNMPDKPGNHFLFKIRDLCFATVNLCDELFYLSDVNDDIWLS